MDVPPEQLHFEMTFNGELEDVKSGAPIAIENGSATPFGETIEEFKQDLQRFNEAEASPPLDYDLFPTRGSIPWP